LRAPSLGAGSGLEESLGTAPLLHKPEQWDQPKSAAKDDRENPTKQEGVVDEGDLLACFCTEPLRPAGPSQWVT